MNVGWFGRRAAILAAIIVFLRVGGDQSTTGTREEFQSTTGISAGVARAAEPAAPASGSWSAAGTTGRQDFVPQQLLVQFREGVEVPRVEAILRQTGAEVIKEFHRSTRLKLLKLPDTMTTQRAVPLFGKLPEVEIAEPNFYYFSP